MDSEKTIDALVRTFGIGMTETGSERGSLERVAADLRRRLEAQACVMATSSGARNPAKKAPEIVKMALDSVLGKP